MTVPSVFQHITDLPEAGENEDLFVAAETADISEPTKKALLVSYGNLAKNTVNKISDIINANKKLPCKVISFYDGWAVDANGEYKPLNGGEFIYSHDTPKSYHNGAQFISDTVPFDNAHSSLAAWLSGAGETDPTGSGCWVRLETDRLSLGWFGSTGVHADDNKAPIEKFISAWLKGGVDGYIPAGDHKSTDRILFDCSLNPEKTWPKLYGDGPYTSKLTSTSLVGPAIHFYGVPQPGKSPDHFQGSFSRIGFYTDLPSIGIAWGLSDLSDNHGNIDFDQVMFANSNTAKSQSAITLQQNWLFDCTHKNIVVVGNPNHGKALQLRNVHFSTYENGSYSNAYTAIDFVDAGGTSVGEGYCYNVTFNTPDIENVTIGVSCTNLYSEFITINNPFIDIRDPVANAEPVNGYMFDIQQSSQRGGFTINNVRAARTYSYVYGGKCFTPQTQFTKVNLTGRYLGQTTPDLPASDIAWYNHTGQTQQIEIFGGTIQDVFINGESRGSVTNYTVQLNSGEFIAIRYSSKPNWRIRAVL